MALTCARCGAQNPDGNLYCQACGTPLTAAAAGIPVAAPPGPPPSAPLRPPSGAALAYPSPPPGPVGYQSPYYVPGVGAVQAPVHRTPWTLIVAAVVALVVLLAGVGTAIAIIGNHSDSQAGTGLNGGLSSPNPAGSPSPVGSPVSSQGSTASNAGLTVPVPAGWSVTNKDNESITLSPSSNDGAVTAASGISNPSQTAQQNMDSIDQALRSKYPDTRVCPGRPVVSGSFNGAQGLFWDLCFTLTAGGQSVPAVASVFAGANSDGSVAYLVIEVTTEGNLAGFTNEAKPVLQGIHWKLT